MSDDVQVRVRMYRPGLGDCFLLTFTPPAEDAAREPVHVLIDCGVDWNTSGGSDRIKTIVRDIRTTTGDRLDLLVVTHEHWDHVSGFERAKADFEAMDIRRVWLAWTEDPDDAFAVSLEAERDAALQAVAVGCQQLVRNRSGDLGLRRNLAGVGRATARILSFFGSDVIDALGFSKTSDVAMDFVSSLKTDDAYCSPGGEPLTIDALPGVRFYVLGPPKDEALLKRMDPSTAVPETYELGGSFGERRALFAGLQRAAAAGDPDGAPELLGELEASRLRDFPFTANRRLEEGSQRVRELFEATYFDDDQAWRRIDHDWLTSVADLALQIDNAINNTSLVLAVELVASGRVLLFAADAQIGNWLSWHDCEFTVRGGDGADRTVTASDLLARTVLYKVGHHGSHNATLKQQGLDLMSSPELVAMIPVDQRFAEDRKGWHMPHEPLYERLVERARGRVLRIDRDWPLGDDAERPDTLSEDEWIRFRDAVEVRELFVDYRLTGDG